MNGLAQLKTKYPDNYNQILKLLKTNGRIMRYMQVKSYKESYIMHCLIELEVYSYSIDHSFAFFHLTKHFKPKKMETLEATAKKPRCHNCQHAGAQFKIHKLTHLHCQDPKEYTKEKFENDEFCAWDTLRVFNDTCTAHDFKTQLS